MKTYPSDLTESQWQVIENIVDPNQTSIAKKNAKVAITNSNQHYF